MDPRTADELRTDVEGEARNACGMRSLPVVCEHILRSVEELEHQGMEEGAYTVTMEQYIEVARDLCYAELYGRA